MRNRTVNWKKVALVQVTHTLANDPPDVRMQINVNSTNSKSMAIETDLLGRSTQLMLNIFFCFFYRFFTGNPIYWSEYSSVVYWMVVSLALASHFSNMRYCQSFECFWVGCLHKIRAVVLSSAIILSHFYRFYSAWFGSCPCSSWAKSSIVCGFRWVKLNFALEFLRSIHLLKKWFFFCIFHRILPIQRINFVRVNRSYLSVSVSS